MLANDYYLKNFHALVIFVGDTYGSLLSVAEQAWLRNILIASESAQRLYIRLLGRRGTVFRLSKLNYPEISDLPAAVAELVTRELATTDPPDALPSLLPLFTRPELIRRLELRTHKQQPHAEIEQGIAERGNAADIHTLQQADNWVTLLGQDTYSLFTLCFFGNLHQDTSEFVRRDLGTLRYESYAINSASRAFQSRAQIDAHWRYFECEARLETLDMQDAEVLLELDANLPARVAGDPHLLRRVDRLRNRLARQLERLCRLNDALSLYARSARPPSRERQVRVLTELGRTTEALALCRSMHESSSAESTSTDEELQFAEHFLPRLARLCGEPVVAAARYRPSVTRLTLNRGEGQVETVACDFYARFGACFYVENSLLTGVLGLFIWDLIYLPIPGVFFNPFQAAPADFREPQFLIARAEPFQRRLRELDEPAQFAARVWQHFESRQGTVNPLVHWGVLSEELLTLALMRIPVDHWRVLFDRVLRDLRHNVSGLPDLVLFPDSGGYEFLEIKGPGDALQKNQRRWMRYFAEHRIPCRVVHVRWSINP